MKILVLTIMMLISVSVSSEVISFKLIQTLDFNLNTKGTCLVDGEKNGNVYQIIVKKECVNLDFKPMAKIACNVERLIKTKENGVSTFSGTGKCKEIKANENVK